MGLLEVVLALLNEAELTKDVLSCNSWTQEASQASGVAFSCCFTLTRARETNCRIAMALKTCHISARRGLLSPSLTEPCAWKSYPGSCSWLTLSLPGQEGKGSTLCHGPCKGWPSFQPFPEATSPLLLAFVLPVVWEGMVPLLYGFVTVSSLVRIGTCFLLSKSWRPLRSHRWSGALQVQSIWSIDLPG